MNAEKIRLAAVAALLALTFAAIWTAAATGSAWLMLAAVIGGPIAAVAVGLSGVRRP
jgi:hypothetical protein